MFRLWKLDPLTSYDELVTLLSNNSNKIATATINNIGDEIDDNTGVDFPGTCLDLFKSKMIEN